MKFLKNWKRRNAFTDSKEQCGAIMVEAALYFPITIAVVMAIIYLGLFKMQESYFFFQVERAATQLAKEIAYPGYEGFSETEPLSDTKVDFSWEQPSDEQVQSYYEAYNGSMTKIYRIGAGQNTKERLVKYQKSLCKYSTLFSIGTAKASIRVENRFMSQSVLAELKYELPTPGILKYLGLSDKINLYAAAYQPVINTTDFVRNVDLAWDLGKFLLDKLGIKTDKFVENFNKVKEIIF